MPFLHWFKRKPETDEAEDKPVLARNSLTEEAKTRKRSLPILRQETGTAERCRMRAIGRSPVRLPPNPVVAPERAAQPKSPPAPAHLSVPIGAFYAKLPAHLLAPEKPDLTRSVQIAEEDMVLDHETQEATLPSVNSQFVVSRDFCSCRRRFGRCSGHFFSSALRRSWKRRPPKRASGSRNGRTVTNRCGCLNAIV